MPSSWPPESAGVTLEHIVAPGATNSRCSRRMEPLGDLLHHQRGIVVGDDVGHTPSFTMRKRGRRRRPPWSGVGRPSRRSVVSGTCTNKAGIPWSDGTESPPSTSERPQGCGPVGSRYPVDPADVERRIAENGTGVDIHLLGVAMARVNYLVAMLTALEVSEAIGLTVQVYSVEPVVTISNTLAR